MEINEALPATSPFSFDIVRIPFPFDIYNTMLAAGRDEEELLRSARSIGKKKTHAIIRQYGIENGLSLCELREQSAADGYATWDKVCYNETCRALKQLYREWVRSVMIMKINEALMATRSPFPWDIYRTMLVAGKDREELERSAMKIGEKRTRAMIKLYAKENGLSLSELKEQEAAEGHATWSKVFYNEVCRAIKKLYCKWVCDEVLKKVHVDACAICLKEFKIGEEVRATECCHTFHLHCVSKWVECKLNSVNCPLCRHEIVSHRQIKAIGSR